MLTGNKFYNAGLNAAKLPSEENYTEWTPSSVGSSYSKGYSIATGDVRSTAQPLSLYSNMNVPTNNPYQTVDNYKFTLGSVGQDIPNRKGTGLGNALMTILDVMQRPQYLVTNILDEATDGVKSNLGDFIKTGWQGLTGQRKSSITDMFDNLGWENDDSKKWYQGGNLLRTMAGFAGDVLLDPTTYLTGGSAALSKGLGTKALGKDLSKTLTEVLSKSGKEVMEKSSDDLVEGIAKFVGRSSDDVAAQLAKQGTKQGDLASRLAFALGQSTDASSLMAVKANQEAVNNLLDKGIGSINRDTVRNTMLTPLKQQLANTSTNLFPGTAEAFNRTMGQTINRKLGKNFAFDSVGSIDDIRKSGTLDSVRGIVGALTGTSNKSVTSEFKNLVVTKLYKNLDSEIPSSLINTLSDKEYDILDTLCDSFNVGSKVQADSLIQSAQSIGRMRTSTVAKLGIITDNLDEVRGVVKRIDDGIEFGNGIQRVFDKADKAFYIKYHNPFTGTVKPMLEISSMAGSEKAKAAWNALIELNPLSPVLDKAGQKLKQLGVGMAERFSTEYVSKGISKLDDGALDTSRWWASKGFARDTTRVLQQENALPQRAMSSVRIFKSIPELFDNENLRHSASIYIERNNSASSKAAWLYLSKQGLEDGADEALIKEYNDILTTPTLRNKLDSLKFDPTTQSDLVKRAAQQNLYFNTAISQFDGTNHVDFTDDPLNRVLVGDMSGEDYMAKAASGKLDADKIEGYARIYNNTDTSRINPVATPAKSKLRESAESASASKLGRTVDTTASGTSTKAGFMLHRSNKSAWDAFKSDPTQDIDFDIFTRVARRTMESERVVLNKEYIKTIYDYIDNVPGFDTLVSEKNFNGAVAVPLADGKVTFYCHPEIANQMHRVASVFDNASVASKAVGETFAEISNLLKTLQTKYNPSFVLRNGIGEPMMNWVYGVKAASNREATDILKQVDAEGLFKIGDTTFSLDKTGTTKKLFREYETEITPGVRKNVLEYTDDVGTKEVATDIDLNVQRQKIIEASGVNPTYYQMGARKMTAAEVMTEFFNQGLGWSGVTKGNQAKNMRGMLEQEMLGVSSKNGVRGALKTLDEKIGKPGDTIETWSRLAQYIDCLKQGMDVESAAREVRKYHVDYKDLTTFEREKLRNLMPYYTYMRKNLPIQIRLLVERQNKVNIIGQLVDSMYEAVQRDNGGEPLQVPDYLKEGLAIPLDVDENGKITYLNWGLPIADVARLKYDLKELLTENFFSMWSPMLKNPLEYTMNKNMMYGSNIESYEGETQDLLPGVEGSPQISSLGDQILQSLGVVNTLRNAVATGISTSQQGGNGVSAGMAKFATGSILPSKSQEEVGIQQAYDYRDQLYAYIQKLRASGINVPQYTPSLQYGNPVLNTWAASDRLAQQEKQGYLGTSNSQLYQGLLQLLNGQGG